MGVDFVLFSRNTPKSSVTHETTKVRTNTNHHSTHLTSLTASWTYRIQPVVGCRSRRFHSSCPSCLPSEWSRRDSPHCVSSLFVIQYRRNGPSLSNSSNSSSSSALSRVNVSFIGFDESACIIRCLRKERLMGKTS